MSEISTWSATAADNDGSPPDFLAEGCAPSSVNDAFRELQASVRRWYIDAQWADWGHTPTRVDGDTFTVATDLTAVYQVGRRLKVDGSATGYCTIASSSYSAPNTTVNVTMDTGSLPATLSTIYVGVLSASNGSIPLHSASLLTSGSLPDARLSANVPLLNAANTFTAAQTIGLAGSYAAPQLVLADAAYGVGVDATGNVLLKNTNNGVFLLYGADDAIKATFSNGNIEFAAPGSGVSLTVNGTASGAINLATTAGVACGLLWTQAGQKQWFVYQPASDDPLTWYDGTAARMALNTGLVLGAPTGGDKGAGTLNTAGAIYQNNVAAQSLPLVNSTSTTLAKGQIHHIAGTATIPALVAGEWVCVVNTSGSGITINKVAASTSYWTAAGSSISNSVTLGAYGRLVVSGSGSAYFFSGDITGSA